MLALESRISRGRALEEAFFYRLDGELTHRFQCSIERDLLRRRLAEATGFTSSRLLDHLAEQGFEPQTLAALKWVPCVFVAWANGYVTDEEDRSVIQIAIRGGLAEDSPEDSEASLALVQLWLRNRPPRALWRLWCEYAMEVQDSLPQESRKAFKKEILDHATRVGRASGGMLGFGKLSANEQVVLTSIDWILS